jgi:DNA-binding MarR family transcriptional regulator
LEESEGGPVEFLDAGGVFSSQQRFTIMLILYLHKKAGFTELQRLLGFTPGNLDHHVRRLEEAGYVRARHVLDWRPLKTIEITRFGAAAFREYALSLRRLLEQVT